MAINIGENQNEQVTYVNSPDINRVLFKNLKEGASKEDIVDAVNAWLDEHPEATTTVEDGSILPVKLDSTNSASDGYVLSYNATAGKFEWVDIQSDITELKADLDQVETVTGKEKVASNITFTDGSAIYYSTGAYSSSGLLSRSPFISIPDGFDKLRMTMIIRNDDINTGMAFYTSNSDSGYISGVKNRIVTEPRLGSELVEIDIPEGAKYFRTSWIATSREEYATNTFYLAFVKNGKVEEVDVAGFFLRKETTVSVSNLLTMRYALSSSIKWEYQSGSSRASVIQIPDEVEAIKIGVIAGTVIVFPRSIPNTWSDADAKNKPADLSVFHPTRYVATSTETLEFKIEPDMKYMYVSLINSSGNSVAPTDITFYSPDGLYDEDLYPYVCDDWVLGGINTATGGNTTANDRIRTQKYHKIDNSKIIWLNTHMYYCVVYYDENMNVLGKSSNITERTSRIIKQTDIPGAVYFRLIAAKFSGSNFTNFDYATNMPALCMVVTNNAEGFSSVRYGLVHDVPENIGVLNTISRALQCSSIEYETKAVLPNQKADVSANTEVKGIPYSSVRVESLYVPNGVSFDSFMTAIMNPNSYVYTRQSSAPNSKTYYGTVCSALVSYALDFPAIYTTHQIGELEDVELIEDQSVYGMKLGMMLLRVDHHIALITGIYRDTYGRIKYVELTEAIEPNVITHFYTPEQIKTNYFDKGFDIYKYNKIDQVGYTESDWVSVCGELPKTPSYNTNLSPRRGDKANWRYGEDVEVDVLDAGDYTTAVLYKGETQVDSQAVSSLLTYTNLETGSYKLKLTDGTNDSGFVYFDVVDVEITAVEDQGNKTAKISFTCSANATPKWYAWCYASGDSVDSNDEVRLLTATDITNGYVISEYNEGTFKFRVVGDTVFGSYSSDLVQQTITN